MSQGRPNRFLPLVEMTPNEKPFFPLRNPGLTRMIHERFYCNHRYPAATSLAYKIDGKGLLRREVIERSGTSKLGLAGRLALRDLNILFQVCVGPSGFRALVSRGVLTVSSRTLMNNAG